jgi:methylmalonyl-CoA/ethylmalonyl-CoA epimerase
VNASKAPCKIHHVGVIVPDEEQVAEIMELLGLRPGTRQYVPEYEADCIFTEGEGAAIEFIVPRGGKLAEYNKGVGGLHHIALETDDLAAASRRVHEHGGRLLTETPVRAGNLLINFLSPTYTRGLIVEFVQEQPTPDRIGELPRDE